MTAEQITTTIETLTAEVRAVMIGKRQVTLSVYRQLDDVPWADIEPFGRVRDSKDGSGIYVVGRHRDTGVLSRSSIHRDHWWKKAPNAYLHWLFHQSGSGPDHHRVASAHGRQLLWDTDFQGSRSQCPGLHRLNVDRSQIEEFRAGNFCDLPGLETQWQAIAAEQVAKLLPHELEYQEAEKLPLVVLAGLR